MVAPTGADMEGVISTAIHKPSLLLGATGLQSDSLRVTVLSRDRCQPSAPSASGRGLDTGRKQQV